MSKKKVLIDPGHAPGNANRGPTGYYEYWGMWIVSNCLKVALERSGVIADLTRTKNQNPSLEQRGEQARGYDLFISEHSNASADGRARGCVTFYSVRRPNDRVHAAAISKAASELMENPNRGARTRLFPRRTDLDYYGVIRHSEATGCPHIFLAESGFHDNKIDEAWLKSENNLEILAELHADLICSILGVNYVSPDADDGTKDVLYRVQVGAYSIKRNAERQYHRLNERGYDTYLIQGDDGLYRVQTGAFAVRSNADQLSRDLRADGFETYITTRGGKPAKVGSAPEPIGKGDRVKVRNGAKSYTGGGLADEVYRNTYDVIQRLPGSDRVVIGRGKAVTAAMNVKDLIKV